MFTSFSTALSALNATSTAIDVVGNNLANMNTPGFKSSSVVFRDLITQSLGAGLGETQVGFGTGQPLTIRQFTQGAIQPTSGLLDAAIQGDGFFITQNSQGATQYTRAGNFKVDSNGTLLTDTGNAVQGWSADPVTGLVNSNGPIGKIVVPMGALKAPVATTGMTTDMNLNSADPVGAASNFSTPLDVYDSLGGAHILTVTLQKTGTNTWSYQVSGPGADFTAGTAGTPFPIPGASGTLTFDPSGNLITPAAGAPIAVKLTGLSSGAADMNIAWDLYNKGAGRITQFGAKSSSSASAQNGSGAAQLTHVGLSDGGELVAQYSDGVQAIVGQVALASIRNPATLIAEGNNAFQLSALTAVPAVGAAGTGGRGTIAGGSIEASTVDIATEFTNLIVYQRGYEANGKVITTADQLSQDTINLIH